MAARDVEGSSKGEASGVTQIRALLKKNFRVHVRTNALPFCSYQCANGCVPVSACILHVCCPIFFVAVATALPWIIIKGTLNNPEEFLDVTVSAPQIAKPWPGFEADFGVELDEAPYRIFSSVSDMYGLDEASDEYFSSPPFLSPLFKNKTSISEGYDEGDQCEFLIKSCHCKTLAIVGPDSATAPFKTFMQERYEEWESTRDTLNVNPPYPPPSESWGWPSIVAALTAKTGLEDARRERVERRMAAAPLRVGPSKEMLDPLKRLLTTDPGDIGMGPPRLQRRLQRGRGGEEEYDPDEEEYDPDEEEEYDPDDACTWPDWKLHEGLACDVDEGHNKPIFRIFTSADEVDDWIDSEEYGRYSRDRSETSAMDRLCGAVIFENDVLSESQPAYTIRLNVTSSEGEADGLTNFDIHDNIKYPGTLRWYMRSGFVQLQYLVQRFIGEERTGQSQHDAGGRDLLSSEPHFIFAVTGDERFWEFGDFVGGILGNPIVLTAMFGPMASSIAFYLSRERATRQRELMRMMGLSDSALIWSWIIMFVGLNFIIAFFQALLFQIFFFKGTNIILIWTLLWFFSNAVTTFGMAVSAFITSDRMGATCAFGLFLGLSFTGIAIQQNDSNATKVLWSLIPNNAFFLSMTAVWNWELRGVGATLGRGGEKIYKYAVADGIGMLFLDFWLYLAIYYYADSVIPWHDVGVPRKAWFCFTPEYWREVMGKPPLIYGSADASTPQMERQSSGDLIEKQDDAHLTAMVESKKCVIIRNLFKKFWNASGHEIVAVNNLSLTMYQDECFCLLGHNGAGKTTTMMMLTGCMPQTSGRIEVKGSQVPEEIRTIRSSMGFCPQHNVLIDELTVMEHLELFGTIGGMPLEGLQKRGRELLAAVSLLDKMQARSSALSGGMKRKLSCALAFLSEPYLVILDEPSSGMDPFARRGMWDTLKRWRTGHILCLTTHYMDEADALADRIAIMAEGKLTCSGTSTFLKKKFGLGYIISFVKYNERATQDSEILHAIKGVVRDVEVMSSVGKELLVQVPFAAAENFPTLFPLLDDRKENLGIEAYGTSITNLEEVFLQVARMNKDESQQTSETDDSKLREGEISIKQASFFLQVYALLLRRIRFGYRNRLTCACQMLLPMFSVFVFCAIVFATTSFALQPLVLGTSDWNLDVDSGPRVPITVGVADVASVSQFAELWQNVDGLEAFTTAISAEAYADESEYQYFGATVPNGDVLHGIAAEAGFVKAMQSRAGAHEASQYGSVFYPEVSSWCPAQGRYPAYVDDAHYNVPISQICSDKPGPTLVANVTAVHSAIVMYNLHAGAVLKARAGSGVDKLQLTNHPFQKTRSQRQDTEFVTGIFVAAVIGASFGFIPSVATSYVVMERERDVKNQLIISGCSHLAYWTSNLISDVLWGVLPCVGAIVTFFIFSLDSFIEKPGLEGSIALFAMFLPAAATFAYLFSFLFSKSGVALFVSWIFNMLFGILATTIVNILQGSQDTVDASDAIRWICRFVPVFSLGHGHLVISVKQPSAEAEGVGAITGLGVGGERCPPLELGQERYIKQWFCTFMIGDDFLILIVSTFLFFGLVLLIDIVFGLPAVKKQFAQNVAPWIAQMQGTSLEDDAVLDEKERVNNVDVSKQFVYVNDIHKVYNGKMHAVRGISFAADEGQVFGLLGVNGAGKTTTFKMLCGQVEPSAGTVCIQGIDVSRNAGEARRHIGYCPQFDALLDSLTTREHLELYGRIKGLNSVELDKAVSQQIRDLDLGSYVYSRAGQLSGGNKRKTSVAMATIGEPPMVFLDEPSAGMDPVARRGMWSVIQNIADKRKKSVVILTTHSMEEAEALCSRIAIQVDGLFRCLGTAQQIKSRYGQGLELNVRLATPTQDELNECAAALAAGCNAGAANVLSSSDATSSIERFFDGGPNILYEINSRNGSPLSTATVEVMLLSEWVLLVQRTQAFERFLVQKLQEEAKSGDQMISSLEKSQNVIRYQITAAALKGKYQSLGELFNLFQQSKEQLKLVDFQVCQPSLEQVFNKFATTQITQAAQQQALQPEQARVARVAPLDVDAVSPLPGQPDDSDNSNGSVPGPAPQIIGAPKEG